MIAVVTMFVLHSCDTQVSVEGNSHKYEKSFKEQSSKHFYEQLESTHNIYSTHCSQTLVCNKRVVDLIIFYKGLTGDYSCDLT